MDKFIEIHRHFNLVEMSQEDPEVKAWLGEAYKPIGPYFKGKVTASGLDFTEQKLLLPEHLGIESNDKDFRRIVNNFYDNLLYRVNKDGLRLNIGLQDNSKPLHESNLPECLPDYLKYRHAIEHPDVAESKEVAVRDPRKRFYVHDPSKANEQALSANSLEDQAFALYMKFKDDEVKVDQILTMMGRDVAALKKDKILVLKEFSKKNSKLSEMDQRDALKKFINLCLDKDLEMKYLIQEGIAIQYLKRVGTNILYGESGKQIGVNMEDTVLYFKNPKNSRELNLLRAEYETKLKKDKRYLPKEEETVKES